MISGVPLRIWGRVTSLGPWETTSLTVLNLATDARACGSWLITVPAGTVSE